MIYMYLAEGFEEIEAITIIDVLRRGGLEIKSVSITGDLMVKGAHDISVKADILYDETDHEACEMIVLPGGMPGTTNLAAHERLLAHIACFAENDKYIAAICAAPMVFGQLGVLKDKKATIFTGMEAHLTGASYSADRVVIDGKIVTSKGPGTAMEFAVALVGILKGSDAAAGLKKAMIMN